MRIHCLEAEIDISPKITLQPIFSFDTLFLLMLLMDFFKNMYNYHYQYGQNNKKVKKCMKQSFHLCFMVTCSFFQSYLVLQNKRKRKDEKKINKKKNKVMTQLLEAYVSLPINSASLVLYFI